MRARGRCVVERWCEEVTLVRMMVYSECNDGTHGRGVRVSSMVIDRLVSRSNITLDLARKADSYM